MIAALADRAGLTEPEFRARLNDAGVGASGHGDGWEGRARALADQVAKENQGVLAGGVVGQPSWNDDAKVELAERALHAKLRQEFFAVSPDADFRVWSKRGAIHSPSGDYLAHGWKLHFAVKPPFNETLKGIIDQFPNEFEGFELWCENWSEALIRETF